ncbi:MAG: spore cortex biosynthesis protein YabQ [Clostridia bacterium]
MFETAGQAWAFWIMLYGGLAMGLLYDVLSLARWLLRAGPYVTGVLDLFFWLAASVLASCALAYAGGTMRLYTLVGCACGALLYALGPGHLLRTLCRRLPRKKSDAQAGNPKEAAK